MRTSLRTSAKRKHPKRIRLRAPGALWPAAHTRATCDAQKRPQYDLTSYPDTGNTPHDIANIPPEPQVQGLQPSPPHITSKALAQCKLCAHASMRPSLLKPPLPPQSHRQSHLRPRQVSAASRWWGGNLSEPTRLTIVENVASARLAPSPLVHTTCKASTPSESSRSCGLSEPSHDPPARFRT